MQRGNNEPNQDPRGHIPPQPPPLLSMLESFTELHHQQGPRVWHSPSDSTNNFVSAQPGNSRSSDSSRFFQESVEMTPQQSQQTRDGPTQGEPATLPAHVNVILSKFMNQGTSRHHHHPQTSLRKRKFRGYHDNPRDNCVDFFDVTVTKCSVGKEALRQLDIHPSTIMRNASGSERQPLTTTDTLDCPHLKAALFGNANSTSDVPPQSRQYSYKADSVGVTCDPTASDYSQYAYDCPEWSQNANTRVPNHVQVPPDRLHTGQAVRRTGTPELQMTVSSLSNSPTTTEEDPLDLSRKKRPGHEIWSDNSQVSEKTTPESDSNNIQFTNNGEDRKDDNTQSPRIPGAVFVSESHMHVNTENTLPVVDLSRNNFKPSNNGLQRLRGESSSKPIQHHGSKTSGQRSHPSASSFATLVGNQHANEPDANIKAGCPPQQGIHGPNQGSVLPGYPGNPYQSPGWRQPAGLHVRPPPGLLIQAPSNPKPSNGSHPEVAMQLQGSYAYGQHPNIPYRHPVNQQVPNQAYPPLPPDRFQSASPYVRGRAPNSYPSASPVYYPHNTTALSSSVQPRPMWSNPHYAEAPSKPFDKPLQSGPRPLQEQHARTATQAPLPQSWYPSSSLQPLQHSVRPELHVARGRGQVAPGAQWPSQPQPEDSRIIQPSQAQQPMVPQQQSSVMQSLSLMIRNTLETPSPTPSTTQKSSAPEYTMPKQPLAEQTTTLHQPQSSSSVPSDGPQSPSRVLQSVSVPSSPLSVPQSPLLGPQSPSDGPQSPSRVLQSPSSVPSSPLSVPQSPLLGPQSPSSMAQSTVQSPSSKLQTPSSLPQSPTRVLQSPSLVPSSPLSVPKQPLLGPQSPSSMAQSIIDSMVQSPSSKLQTPLSLPQSPTRVLQSPSFVPSIPLSVPKQPSPGPQSPSSMAQSTVQSPSSKPQSPSPIVHSPSSKPQSPSSIPQSPSSMVQSPSFVPQSPSSKPQSPSSISQLPSSIPQSPSFVPQSPSSMVQSPLPVPQSPSSMPQLPSPIVQSPSPIVQSPSSIVQSPSPMLQSPSSMVQSPSSIVQSPSSIPQSPSSIPQSPSYMLQSPSYMLQSPSSIVVQSPFLEPQSPSSDSADSKAAEMPLLLAFLNSAPVHKATKSATPKQVPQDKHQQSPPSGNKPQGSSSGVINDIEELRSLLLEENAEDGEEFPTSRQSRDVGPCNYKNPQLAYYWDCLQTTLPSPFDKNPAYDRWNTYNGWHTYNTYAGMREQRGPTKRRQAGHPADNMVLKKRQMRRCLDRLENRHRCESTDTDGGNSRNADALNRENGWRAREPVVMAMPRQGMQAVISPRELTCTSSLQRLEGPALLMANRIRLVQEKPLRPPPPLIKIKQT